MAMPILDVPEFPDVPNVPGVPPLIRDVVGVVANVLEINLGDILSLFSSVWGVYDSAGQQVLIPDTVLGISYRNNRRIATYPIEQGAFASYNKVQDPFDADVKMAVGGSRQDRETFLNALESLANSLDLYTLVIPEASYENINLEHFDYLRETQNGAGIVIANCHFVEIRQATAMLVNGVADPTNVQSPSSSAMVSQGNVTAQTPSSSLTSTVVNALVSAL